MKRMIFVSLFIVYLFIVTVAFPAEKGAPPAPETIARPNVIYKAEGLKDPFQNPIMEGVTKPVAGSGALGGFGVIEGPPPPLTVQGLIWGGFLPQAIVNNKIVKVGDTIDGANIISIDKNGVTVLFQEREYKLSPLMIGTKSSKKP
jgi:hypothetical protein